MTFSDLDSSQISPSKQEMKEMKYNYYLHTIPTKVETDDVLNSIFGTFKDRFTVIAEMSDKIMKNLYRKYHIDEKEFYRV